MKKIRKFLLTCALLGTVALSAIGCGSNGGSQKSGYELALVIDVGTIDDKSFNQGSWEGLEKYAKESGKTYKYYKSTEATTDSFKNTVSLAIEGGAKVVVCPGYLFEPVIYDMQAQHPDVNFILIDGEPHSEGDNPDYRTDKNTCAILYEEDQAGYLAGYAAVKDGYKKLGFMGGMPLPAVVRYGYGFVQGAEAAAEELGETDLELKYTYTGSFDATPEAQSTAASWYQSGTEVIFACGGSVGNSVMTAAESSNGKVIGVDVDQSSESATVITSAMKELANSVYTTVKDYYDGNFKGGQTVVMDAAANGVGLPMSNSHFNNFTQADYDAVFNQLASGEVKPLTDKDVEDVSKLPVKNIKVDVIE